MLGMSMHTHPTIVAFLLAVDAWRAARDRFRAPAAQTAVTVGLSALILLLVAAPLLSLSRYYARGVKAEPTNASLIRAIADIQAALRPGEVVILDNNLNDRRTEYASPWDEASTFRVMRYIMEFDSVPYEVVDVDAQALADLTARRQDSVVILSSGFDSHDTAKLNELIQSYALQGLDARPARAPRPADRH